MARSVAGTTAAIDYPWLPDYLERKLIASAGRAEGAMERSRTRSDAMRQGIRTAVGALPLTQPLHVLVGIVARRMRADAPSARTIRDELRTMREETGNFGTETTAPPVSNGTYRST